MEDVNFEKPKTLLEVGRDTLLTVLPFGVAMGMHYEKGAGWGWVVMGVLASATIYGLVKINDRSRLRGLIRRHARTGPRRQSSMEEMASAVAGLAPAD
jgi:hypothetical protein